MKSPANPEIRGLGPIDRDIFEARLKNRLSLEKAKKLGGNVILSVETTSGEYQAYVARINMLRAAEEGGPQVLALTINVNPESQEGRRYHMSLTGLLRPDPNYEPIHADPVT